MQIDKLKMYLEIDEKHFRFNQMYGSMILLQEYKSQVFLIKINI